MIAFVPEMNSNLLRDISQFISSSIFPVFKEWYYALRPLVYFCVVYVIEKSSVLLESILTVSLFYTFGGIR